ncbi:hypothetical protein JT358_00815 [Micrococcales bacterium 31B]|nr:hypothetical protein [Micrococcales bacterium 31B]
MIRDIRLGLRLIAGAGPRDILRIALMVAGLAIALASVLLCLAVPTALARAEATDIARTPIVTTDTGAAFAWGSVRQAETVPWHSVTVGGDLSGVKPPPGLSAWPEPGHSIVSPALLKVLQRDKTVGFELGIVDATPISPEGLVSPRELYSYTRTAEHFDAQRLVGFGDPSGTASLPTNTSQTYASLALFTLAPALLFASICLGFSARSRRGRYQRLVKIGLAANRCARIFAAEMTAVGIVSLAVAYVIFSAVQSRFGENAWLGVAWFPQQALLPTGVYVALAAVTLGLIAAGSARHMRRALGKSSQPSRRNRWVDAFRVLAGGGLLLAAAGFTAVSLPSLMSQVPEYQAGDNFIIYSMSSALAGLVGLLLLNPYLLSGLRRVAERLQGMVPVKMGMRLAHHHASRVTTLTAAVACALMVSSFAGGMLSAFARDTANDAGWQTFNITGDLSLAQRQELMRLSTAHVDAIYMTPEFHTVSTFACPAPGHADTYLVEGCREEPQRGVQGANLPPSLQVKQLDGSTRTVTLPAPLGTSHAITDLKLPLDQGQWILSAADMSFAVTVYTEDNRLAKTMDAIHKIVKDWPLNYGVKNEEGYYNLNAGAGAVNGGTILGFGILFMCLLFVLIEIRWEMARSIASQQALGMRPRTLRLASLCQLTAPLLIPGLISLTIGSLSAMICQAVFGRLYMNLASVALAPSIALAASLIFVAACGYAMGSPRFNRDLLATDA